MNPEMRTTLNLDDEIHALASAYARARHISLGAAIGELVRKGQRPVVPPCLRLASSGLPVFLSRGAVLTTESVRQAREDDAP
jgi:hypothetical protein